MKMNNPPWFLLILSAIGFLTNAAMAENYPSFRGTLANAVSPLPLPTTWSDDEQGQKNILWKVELAGEGWSQPIVWQDRLYLTAAVPADPQDNAVVGPEPHQGGYGRNRDDLVNVTYQYQVSCRSVDTGEEIWRRDCQTRQTADSATQHEHLCDRNAGDRR